MPYEQKKPEPLTDDSLMPSGKHKGTRMEDVPATHLMYIYDNDLCKPEVKVYIEENMDVILKQAKQDGYAGKE